MLNWVSSAGQHPGCRYSGWADPAASLKCCTRDHQPQGLWCSRPTFRATVLPQGEGAHQTGSTHPSVTAACSGVIPVAGKPRPALGGTGSQLCPWGYTEDAWTGAGPEVESGAVVGGRTGRGLPAPPTNLISGCLLWALAAVPRQVRSCCAAL